MSEGKVKVNQERLLSRLLRQGHGEVAGEGGDTCASLGTHKHHEFAAALFCILRCGTTNGSPHQRLSHNVVVKRNGQELARTGTHAAHQQIGVGFCRVDHYGGSAICAYALHQVQRVFGVAVEIDDDHIVMLFQQAGHIVQAGRVGRELADFSGLAACQGTGRGRAPPLVWTDNHD